MARTVVHLSPEAFGERERPLLETDGLSVSGFRFGSGVAGLRCRNDLGEIVMLPFQGQQVWSANFLGRELTMVSMFDEPQPTRNYLETYGAFLIHCGISAMGVPAEGDQHPVHGELPNAPFRDVYVLLDEDAHGPLLAIGGSYRHTVAFQHNYLAGPRVTMRPGSSLLEVELSVSNLKRSPMELMYLAHANFRPVNGGHLVYSAEASPEHVRVRRSIPSHISPPPGYAEFLEQLAEEPARHHRLDPELAFDPEVVFFIDFLADEAGWAHSLQRHPDGSADVIRHRPAQLDVGVRWISRTADQDALGLLLPATAEPEGYSAEKAKGNIKLVPPGERWRCRYQLGALAPEAAERAEAAIAALLAGRHG